METILLARKIINYAPMAQSATNSIVFVPLMNLMKYKSVSYENEYAQLIADTDLINKIEIYSCLLNELPETDSTAIRMAQINIKNSMVEIESILKKISYKLAYNKNLLLFSSFRSYSTDTDLQLLKKNINILDQRISLLKTLFDVTNSCNSKIINEKINVIYNYIESK